MTMALATPPEAASEHDAAQRRVTVDAIEEIAKAWGTTPPKDFDAWFARNIDRLVATATDAQARAVASTDRYVTDVLDEQRAPARRVATPTPERLVGVTGDGRTIDGLLHQAIVHAQQRVAEGEAPYRAWQAAGLDARMYINTIVADAGRAATGVAITSRLGVGYRRMLVPPSCSRCVVLAGRYYHWSAGFRRHPNCNCRHIPAPESTADSKTTDPKVYFNSLSEDEQRRTFGAAAARAIRDGADMSQVVNARRGLTIVGGRAQRTDVFGQQLLTTTEGVTRRGAAGRAMRARGRNARSTPRLMPEAIYEIAGTQAEAIELLRKNGYIR